MKPSSLRRIANFRTVIAALSERSMDPAAVAQLLTVSHTAGRNYLHELVEAGVAVTALKTHVRLHDDADAVERFIAGLTEDASAERITVRRSPRLSDSHAGKRFFHVLADDVSFPLMVHRMPVRRDPLVAALFGAAG